MKLITILPDVVKSPKLTADWENELTLVSKGEVAAEQFMSGMFQALEGRVAEVKARFTPKKAAESKTFSFGTTE